MGIDRDVHDRTAAIQRFREEASRCTRCREHGLLYQHENGRWAYPLFHLESTCSSGIVAVAEAPNLDDTLDADKGRLTYDAETDPTGRFALKLLKSVRLHWARRSWTTVRGVTGEFVSEQTQSSSNSPFAPPPPPSHQLR